MKTKENLEIDYRLPQFANLSGGVALFGLVSFIIAVIFSLMEEEILSLPISFVVVSFVAFLLGNTGLFFSTKDFIEKAANKKSSMIIMRSIIFLCLPAVTIFLDKNISQSNVPYFIYLLFYYIFVFCYTSLLIWYVKNHSHH